MYLGIDIGGTKTLLAALDTDGRIVAKVKFPTDKDYLSSLEIFKQHLGVLTDQPFDRGAAGIPASVLDRAEGVGVRFGNLPWQDVPIGKDLSDICGCPVAIENDAKLAGLSEAALLRDSYRSVLYVTVSTGIGYALISDGGIDINVGDAGGRALLLEHEGKVMPWEDFASGRAIVERYGKPASDIEDEDTWRRIGRDLSQGLIRLVAVLQPQAIVIGGSVGTYFDRYGSLLDEALREYELPQVALPKLLAARRPEEAVIDGCYRLIRQLEEETENKADHLRSNLKIGS